MTDAQWERRWPPESRRHLVAWALILLHTLERDGTFTSRYSEGGSIGDTDNDLASLRGIIVALDRDVLPRLHGIREAAVRAHQDRGGSYGQLAAAMNIARSTAPTRADTLAAAQPSPHERWARGLGPLVRPSSPVPAGPAGPPGFHHGDLLRDRHVPRGDLQRGRCVRRGDLPRASRGRRGEVRS
ncbi:hypothetical protein [Actinomadura litoris]|uniref:Uncharacterized protein n=1 Tax=Actinomadura litoris TaxID=2678616 RepID=A0A7K1L404_9ACTN|nr:hypothetical protein [Actinomadura litoris]MUN39005.1 hypothetical protein [Actinomadura litoris]